MHVMKFGGTSISSVESLLSLQQILRQTNDECVVIISAFKGVTNALTELITLVGDGDLQYERHFRSIIAKHKNFAAIIYEGAVPAELSISIDMVESEVLDCLLSTFEGQGVTPEEKDYYLSRGEQLSGLILSHYLRDIGFPLEFVDAKELITTDSNYGNATIHAEVSLKNIQEKLLKNKTKITLLSGFVASSSNGTITTLGKGGSDLTLATVGEALKPAEVIKWTDVDGIMTADPKLVKSSMSIDYLSYDELYMLSILNRGVVVHAEAINALKKSKVPLIIKNTFNTSFQGTVVNQSTPSGQVIFTLMEDCQIFEPSNQTLTEVTSETDFLNESDVITFPSSNNFLYPLNSLVNQTSDTVLLYDQCYRRSYRKTSLIGIVGDQKRSFQNLQTTKKIISDQGLELLGITTFRNTICLLVDEQVAQKLLSHLHDKFYTKSALIVSA